VAPTVRAPKSKAASVGAPFHFECHLLALNDMLHRDANSVEA
jgi:hypothetical protein